MFNRIGREKPGREGIVLKEVEEGLHIGMPVPTKPRFKGNQLGIDNQFTSLGDVQTILGRNNRVTSRDFGEISDIQLIGINSFLNSSSVRVGNNSLFIVTDGAINCNDSTFTGESPTVTRSYTPGGAIVIANNTSSVSFQSTPITRVHPLNLSRWAPTLYPIDTTTATLNGATNPAAMSFGLSNQLHRYGATASGVSGDVCVGQYNQMQTNNGLIATISPQSGGDVAIGRYNINILPVSSGSNETPTNNTVIGVSNTVARGDGVVIVGYNWTPGPGEGLFIGNGNSDTQVARFVLQNGPEPTRLSVTSTAIHTTRPTNITTSVSAAVLNTPSINMIPTDGPAWAVAPTSTSKLDLNFGTVGKIQLNPNIDTTTLSFTGVHRCKWLGAEFPVKGVLVYASGKTSRLNGGDLEAIPDVVPTGAPHEVVGVIIGGPYDNTFPINVFGCMTNVGGGSVASEVWCDVASSGDCVVLVIAPIENGQLLVPSETRRGWLVASKSTRITADTVAKATSGTTVDGLVGAILLI